MTGPVYSGPVEQNGRSYHTDVRDLLALFGRQQLTTKARLELSQELMRVGVAVRPDLSLVERNDPIELFILTPMPRMPQPGGRPAAVVLGVLPETCSAEAGDRAVRPQGTV